LLGCKQPDCSKPAQPGAGDLKTSLLLATLPIWLPLYIPKGHPQVANVAINQARLLAKNLQRMIEDMPLQDYEYKDMGSMATIGRNKAVVDLPFVRFKGYLAWLVWMFLHLMLILSVKNKLIIFINWAWSYLTKDSSLRLILTPDKPHSHK
jgi:NADH:ubiquinone reductase (H+-translocating)